MYNPKTHFTVGKVHYWRVDFQWFKGWWTRSFTDRGFHKEEISRHEYETAKEQEAN